MSFNMRLPRFVGMSSVDAGQSGLRQLVTFCGDNGLVSRGWCLRRTSAGRRGRHQT